MWIKVNDTVEVISGEDRGTRSKVMRVNHDEGKLVVHDEVKKRFRDK